MYWSIPDTTDISAKNSSHQQAYTLFNIHLNGVHHCSVRYSQLHTFNDELQRFFTSAMSKMPAFPPKKFLSLSSKDTEERRSQLENYLQHIVQNKYLVSSSYFKDFFLNAQQETFSNGSLNKNNDEINLAIRLLNNHEITIENFSLNSATSRLLDACASKIQLNEDFLTYFALYFYDEQDNELHILRPLYEFESPYLSLKQMRKVYEHACIVLKKSYWNSDNDLLLLDDRRTRNLLFVQAQYEIEQSRSLSINTDIDQQLQILRDNSSLKEYILLARTSKFYGHIVVRQCSILYPIADKSKQKLRPCSLIMGNSELTCFINLDDNKKTSSNNKEVSFKVTRIRCWKSNRTQHETNIAMEYLIKKDHLEWITIHTMHAALVSSCLQEMVDEILLKKAGAANSVSAPVTSDAVGVSSKSANGLMTRSDADVERLNNNDLFDRGEGDDEL
jgi:sorting nexin-17